MTTEIEAQECMDALLEVAETNGHTVTHEQLPWGAHVFYVSPKKEEQQP